MTTLHQAQASLQTLVSGALAGIVTGAKETITLGGQVTPLDVLTLSLTGGVTATVTYTVKAGDAMLNVAQGLARALNANPAVRAGGLSAIASASTPNVFVYYPVSPAVTWGSSLSPGATESIALANQSLSPQVGIGWPPLAALQEVARGGAPLVAIYDRRIGRNMMRWNPYVYNQTAVAPGVTTVVAPASGMVQPGGQATISLGGAPALGDAVSCVINNRAITQSGLHQVNIGQTAAQVVSAAQGDTAATMATKLAAAINGDPVLGTWVSAGAVGGVVTLTSLVVGAPITVQSFAGNGGSQLRELIRKERMFQVVSWTKTELQRQMLVDPIDEQLAIAQATFLNVVDPAGHPIRVIDSNDFDIEDDTLEDVYRHDFLVTLEYSVTTTDQLYAVLAPVVTYQVAD